MAIKTVSTSVIVCSFLMVIALMAAYITKQLKFNYFPESASAMFLGMLFGGITLALKLDLDLTFSPEIFFYGLLPIIIFNAGYALRKKDFFRNFNTIILFAVVGTIISALVYGLATYGLYLVGVITHVSSTSPLLECLMFGSLISAIDPVATLSIFQDVHAPSMLYNLVFGESLVNDASSIVLFRTFESFLDTEFSLPTIGVAISWFCVISVGSIVLGVAFSLGCALVLKYIDINSEFAKFELSFILLSAYLSYAVAEMMGLSGIMSLFFCGIFNAHYGYYSTSHATKIGSKYAFEALAFLSELFVFAYLGMQVVVLDHVVDYGLILTAIPLCLLSRAVNVFPLAWLANLGRSKPITKNMMIMMWLSGLRGAIAFALAANMPTNNRAIETTTLFIVVFTTVIFGGGTAPSLQLLGLTPVDGFAPGNESVLDMPLIAGQSLFDLMDRHDPNAPSGFQRSFQWFDQTYMKPIFGGQIDRSLEIGSFRDEEEQFNEVPDIVWVEHYGTGFSLHAPSEWEESFDMYLDDRVLTTLVCPEEGEGEGEPAAVVEVILHQTDKSRMEEYGEPMDFLSHKWKKYDLGGEGALAEKIEKAVKDFPSQLSEPSGGRGRLVQPKTMKEDMKSEKTEKRILGSFKRLDSLPNVSIVDPAGVNFTPSSTLIATIKEQENTPDQPNSTLSRGPEEGKLTAGSRLTSNSVSRSARLSTPGVHVPAFVMWADSYQDQKAQTYYRYEVVLHPEDLGLKKAHIRHILLSVSIHADALYVCRMQGTEKWWYDNGLVTGRQIVDSFRVGMEEHK